MVSFELHIGGCHNICLRISFFAQVFEVPLYAPVTLQAVHPTVRGFTWWQNHPQGLLIPSGIWCIHYTTCGILRGYRRWAQHTCPLTNIRGLYVVTQWRNV